MKVFTLPAMCSSSSSSSVVFIVLETRLDVCLEPFATQTLGERDFSQNEVYKHFDVCEAVERREEFMSVALRDDSAASKPKVSESPSTGEEHKVPD